MRRRLRDEGGGTCVRKRERDEERGARRSKCEEVR